MCRKPLINIPVSPCHRFHPVEAPHPQKPTALGPGLDRRVRPRPRVYLPKGAPFAHGEMKVLGRQIILPTGEGVCHFQGSEPHSAGHESSPDVREHSSHIRQYVPTNWFQKAVHLRLSSTPSSTCSPGPDRC